MVCQPMLTQPARRLAALCIFVSAACLTANSLPDKNDKKEEGNVLLNSRPGDGEPVQSGIAPIRAQGANSARI